MCLRRKINDHDYIMTCVSTAVSLSFFIMKFMSGSTSNRYEPFKLFPFSNSRNLLENAISMSSLSNLGNESCRHWQLESVISGTDSHCRLSHRGVEYVSIYKTTNPWQSIESKYNVMVGSSLHCILSI